MLQGRLTSREVRVLKRGAGLALVAAGAASLAASVIVFLAVMHGGVDWSGRFLVQAAAALGMALVGVGAGLLRGLPAGVPERRPTNLLVVLLALALFLPMLAGAVLLFLGNFDGSASTGRWFGTSAFLALSFAGVLALLRDALGRLSGQARRAGAELSSGGQRAAPGVLPYALPRRRDLGRVLFVRRKSRIMGLAIGALSLVLLLLAASLFQAPRAGNDSNEATAIGFALAGVVAGLVAWRSLALGLWFHQHGLRQRTFLSSLSALYEELSEVSAEDLVVSYRGHHHTVIIRFTAQGRSHKLFLTGRVGLNLDERRDPDADAIIRLVTGASARSGAAAG
jgi:hypothetical protein